jgi:hypothetical protein
MPIVAACPRVLPAFRALVLARPAKPVRLGIQKPVQRLLNRGSNYLASVVTLKAAMRGHFKTGHMDWPET